MIRASRSSARAITRAGTLLKVDEGWTAPRVAAALGVSDRTGFRTKRRNAAEGLDEVLRRRNQVNRHRKLDDRGEAHLITPARSPRTVTADHYACWRAGWWNPGLAESRSHDTVGSG